MASLRTLTARWRLAPLHVSRAYSSGDPGPSTIRFRKSQRSQIRSETARGDGRPLDASQLNDLLTRRHESPSASAPTSTSVPAPRSGSRSAFDRRALARAPRVALGGASRFRVPTPTNAGELRVERDKDPFLLSAQLKEFIDKNINSVARPTARNIGHAVAMVKTAPRVVANVVVWNQLLGMLGRVGSLDQMWKTYNDMKKFGIVPSAHTYTTMLNAYAVVPHSGETYPQLDRQAEPRILSRVSILWDQAQLAVRDEDQSGLAVGSVSPAGRADAAAQEEKRRQQARTGPLNAYAKVLSRFGMWQELIKLANAKADKWDVVGYTTVLMGLQHAARTAKVENLRKDSDKVDVPVGPVAKRLWMDALVDLPAQPAKGSVDNTLASLAVNCMLMGRPADQRFALALIPRIWSLPPPMNRMPPLEFDDDAEARDVSNLLVDVKSATSLLTGMNFARLPSVAAHYAAAFLSIPRIRRHADHHFIYAAASAFANASDPASIVSLMDDYSHPHDGWKIGFVYDALTSARWANDWPAMVTFVRRLCLMPPGVENGHITGFYPVQRETKRDVTKRMWVPDITHALDAKCMGIVLKAALSGNGVRRVEEALRIVEWAGVREVLGDEVADEESKRLPSAHRYTRSANADVGRQPAGRIKGWTYEMAKEVVRAVDVVRQARGGVERESAEGGGDREGVKGDRREERERWGAVERAAKACIARQSKEGAKQAPVMGMDKLWRR